MQLWATGWTQLHCLIISHPCIYISLVGNYYGFTVFHQNSDDISISFLSEFKRGLDHERFFSVLGIWVLNKFHTVEFAVLPFKTQMRTHQRGMISEAKRLQIRPLDTIILDNNQNYTNLDPDKFYARLCGSFDVSILIVSFLGQVSRHLPEHSSSEAVVSNLTVSAFVWLLRD